MMHRLAAWRFVTSIVLEILDAIRDGSWWKEDHLHHEYADAIAGVQDTGMGYGGDE